MRAKLIKIGNSQGVRIPIRLIELSHLEEDIELLPEKGRIIIQNFRSPRANWSEEFQKMAKNQDDDMLDSTSTSSWDKKEWTW